MGFVTNKYKNYSPVKQSHGNTCWAACLEFWVKAATGNRSITQKQLRNDADVKSRYEGDSTTGTVYAKSHADYGVLEESEMLWLLKQPKWGMAIMQVAKPEGWVIQDLLATSPVYIGYFDAYSNGNHVNVICGFDESTQMVEVMEPRKGRFVEKGLTTLTSSTSVNLIGWKP